MPKTRAVVVVRFFPGMFATVLAAGLALAAPPPTVNVVSDEAGSKLQVDGEDFMVLGMNWGYIPVGENYSFSLWAQPDEVIETALDREMSLLRDMGVNTIKQITPVPPRWVRYVYERYGIYTILNHQMGRYGYNLDGVWYPSVDYSDPRFREAIKAEVLEIVEAYRDTPGVLMWLLGNESNYGLSWTSFEIEALPEEERNAARARYMYSMFGEVVAAIKEADPHRPVSMANGDIQYIDIIAEELRNLDVFGTNVYRGISVREVDGVLREGLGHHGPLYDVVEAKLGIPVMLTEFGSDAYNAREMREDQVMQAYYLTEQWREIYEQSYGKGGVGNAIGGLVFQWSDGWWKYGQDWDLDIHDTHASWPNAAYYDHVPGENNMNEEWWGICAKGPTDDQGLFEVYPRAAYYALRDAWSLDPYAPDTDAAAIRSHFDRIDPAFAAVEARRDRAALLADSQRWARLSGVRMEFETYSTGGKNITTPPSETPQEAVPSFLGFDRLQSFYVEAEATPAENVQGKLSLNVVGSVPTNPIDQIFYENRGRPGNIQDGPIKLEDIERVKVYQASLAWEDRWFALDAFYRTGHTHWGYDGDFFGLYRDAWYGENIDVYNAETPVGVEIEGKKTLAGATLAFGNELWWGANPSVLVKYSRKIGRFDATGIYQDDFAEKQFTETSFTVPLPPTRKATLHLKTTRGPWGIEVGGIWSGATKVGEPFFIVEGDKVFQDEIKDGDAFGAKAKLTWERGRWHWYAQGARLGLVADGGPTEARTFTGWHLKDSGSGNQTNFITGLAVNSGNFQIAPNFLWQKPIVGPIPGDAPPPGRPRDIRRDPFAVLGNRETVGAEILITYDPDPATWMWQWDNDVREGAPLAASLGFVFRHHPTTRDANIAFLADGTPFSFENAPPARDLWEVHGRLVSRPGPNVRAVVHGFIGTGEPRGDDPRLIRRGGVDARLAWHSMAFESFAKINDWGPYDYHQDFNLTFPVQLMGDVSYTLGKPRWFGYPQTRLGIRGTWRSLNEYSPRLDCVRVPDSEGGGCDPSFPIPDGNEWEFRTYLHLAI